MSLVNLTNIRVLDNPAPFTADLSFEITFECLSQLESDLEFKIIYVGSAEDEKHDQTLDSILVGPVPVGVNKFIFQAEAPNAGLIPAEDVIGVTVVLVTCSYKEREFVRVGYYVNNDYAEEGDRASPPASLVLGKLQRNILADQPRVTRVPIAWDGEEEAPPVSAGDVQEEEEAEMEEEMDAEMGLEDEEGEGEGEGEEEAEIDLDQVSSEEEEEEVDEEMEEDVEQENSNSNELLPLPIIANKDS